MKKKLVYKSNELIECQYGLLPENINIPRTVCLSAGAQKLLAVLVSSINPFHKKLPLLSFSPHQLALLLNTSLTHVCRDIGMIMLELKGIVITLKERNKKSYCMVGLFRECNYNEKNNTYSFMFEEKLEKHLIALSGNFTKYALEEILELKSKYSIRVYELLRKIHPIGCKKSSHEIINILKLREMLGCHNKKTYMQYKYFKRYILDLAKKELKNNSDICFVFKPIKSGKSVTKIEFCISENNRLNSHLFEKKNNNAFLKEEKQLNLDTCIFDKSADKDKDKLVQQLALNMPKNIVKLLASGIDASIILYACNAYQKAIDQGRKINNHELYFLGILSKKSFVYNSIYKENNFNNSEITPSYFKSSYFSAKEAMSAPKIAWYFDD